MATHGATEINHSYVSLSPLVTFTELHVKMDTARRKNHFPNFKTVKVHSHTSYDALRDKTQSILTQIVAHLDYSSMVRTKFRLMPRITNSAHR
jgi:hypothetical protein